MCTGKETDRQADETGRLNGNQIATLNTQVSAVNLPTSTSTADAA
jgi:hypothetical protein